MVFKVFCDINVSQVTSESFDKDENIYYEIIPKYDDDKENWDPNNSKKNNSSSVSLGSITPSKKEQKDSKLKTEKELEKRDDNSNEDSAKENIIKEKNISKKGEENNLNKKSEVSNDTKNEKIEESSKCSADETVELKEENYENYENSKDIEKIIKKKEILLGKRQRVPLADITYLFVQEKHIITPKRVKIIKDEQEKTPELKSVKAVKIEKSTKKENEGSIKRSKILSENSKENKQSISKIPLRNISNCSNVNINNNNNMKYYNNIKKSDVPKPFFIDVKKSKTARKTLIPKKSMKSKPNPFNVSARMLR